MKQLFIFYTLCSFLLLSVTSCTDKEESIRQVEPGIYYIGKDLNAVMPSTQTRGIDDNNYYFDDKYDYNYIYLHKKGTNECIKFDVYSDCPNNIDDSTCKGFRYRIDVADDGSATIYPLDRNGDVVGSESITLGKDDKCYFSSWATDTWALDPSTQISEDRWAADLQQTYYLYYRDANVNKEIYRSGVGSIEGVVYNDLSISDLTTHGDLSLTRACATFALAALFFDVENKIPSSNLTNYYINLQKFKDVMEDSPKNWYIKIYIGGVGFATEYNIETDVPTNTYSNGYYSSGDAAKFDEGDIVGKKYLPFVQAESEYLKGFTNGKTVYNGYGYLSQSTNTLFTPVMGSGTINAYILIKHWTGGPEGPSKEWLNSDIGALQTTVNQNITSPGKANAYVIGFAMDITQFKAAWDYYGGDAKQNELIQAAGIDTGSSTSGGSDNSTSGAYSTTITRSPSGAPVRSFTLPEDAIVIREVY